MGMLVRLMLVFGLGVAAVYVALLPQHYAATLVCVLLCIVSVIELLRFMNTANREMSRFVGAMTSGDLAQSFSARYNDTGFDELAAKLQQAMNKQRTQEQTARQEALMLSALVDDTPVALLQLQDDRINLLNKMARRMFGVLPSAGIAGLQGFGSDFANDIGTITPGQHKLACMQLHGAPVKVMLTVSGVRSGTFSSKVISVQPIQSELDASEMLLSRDLVRILTHEIMNSLTPVTSLAKTASGLMQNISVADSLAIADARTAVDTVARRSESLMQFVRTYRAFAVQPVVNKQSFAVSTLLGEITRLFAAEWPSGKIAFSTRAALDVDIVQADPDLITQVLINLLRNAAEASLEDTGQAAVDLHVSRDMHGHVFFDVSDNGPGIPPDRQQEIFLPFFTTKTQGSGVGLSFSRQIAVAHGGSLAILNTSPGKTCIRLKIP
jgi:two-component system, NtrC family, nitrogen regulation sensor histidine kinase NtrY